MRRMLMFGLVLPVAFAFGLDVDREELEQFSDRTIDFINYEGPYERIDTVEEILGIGRALGAMVGSDYGEFELDGRYRVIHAVDPAVARLLDADILIPLAGSRVDHIDNMRRIIAGFLQRAYGYSQTDSALLSRWVTIYNAVARGNLEFFRARYKQVVTRNLSAENAGLSRRYDEWPGRSRIVIPLSADRGPGVLGTVDPRELIDDRVVEELRTREDRGIDDRQEMIDLTERVIDERERAIERDERAIAEEARRIEAEERALAAERRRIEEEREAARALEERERAEAEAALARREEEARQRAERAAADRAALDEQRRELVEDRQDVAALTAIVRAERERIARDARALLDERAISDEIRGLVGDRAPVFFLQVRDEGGVILGRLVQINPVTGLVLNRSAEDRVVSRTYTYIGDDLLVVVSDGPAGRLATFDIVTLAEKARGPDEVFLATSLSVRENQTAYAVVRAEGQWYLGRFGRGLTLERRSAIPVNPYTTLAFSEGRVWVQAADDRIVALGLDDLRIVP